MGEITGPNETAVTTGGIWNFSPRPTYKPGLIRLQAKHKLTASDQGIYTCAIADDNGKKINIHVGLYPNGFDGEFKMH